MNLQAVASLDRDSAGDFHGGKIVASLGNERPCGFARSLYGNGESAVFGGLEQAVRYPATDNVSLDCEGLRGARECCALRQVRPSEVVFHNGQSITNTSRIASITPHVANPYSAISYANLDRKSTRLNSSHVSESRMPSSA